ncbi:MAG: hypothetical protein M3R17_15690 [Bacteroidota bacterium]|nr:hypothetical protein [Bacteroidota bacterium]
MKRIFLITLLAAPIFWSACSGDKSETKEDIVPKGMIALDLKSMGYPVKINVPDSNYFPVIDSMASANGAQIRIGQHFDILVNFTAPEDADLAKQKELINANIAETHNYLAGDSATLVWETKFGDSDVSMHHFIRLVKIDDKTYMVRDNYDNPENVFSKPDVDKMIESAKSLRARPAGAEAPKS